MSPTTVCRRLVRNDPSLKHVEIVGYVHGNIQRLLRVLSLESTRFSIRSLVLAHSDIRLNTFARLMALLCAPKEEETCMGETVLVSALKKIIFFYPDGQDIAHRLFLGIATNDPSGMADLEDIKVCLGSLNGKSATAIQKALQACTKLSELDLGNNHMTELSFFRIMSALSVNTTLFSLILNATSLGDTGAQLLAQILVHNSTMNYLDLGSNQIGDAGAIALAFTLEHFNRTLMTLALTDNRMGDASVMAWIRTVRVNPSLFIFSIDDNRVSVAAEQAFADSISEMVGLKVVDFGPLLRTATLVRVAAAMERNFTLYEIKCDCATPVATPRRPQGSTPAETTEERAWNLTKYMPLIQFRCFLNKMGVHSLFAVPQKCPAALWPQIVNRFNLEDGKARIGGNGNNEDDDDDDDESLNATAQQQRMGAGWESYQAFRDRPIVNQLGGLIALRCSLIFYALRESGGSFLVARNKVLS